MSGGLVGTITINMGLQLKGSQLAAILRISSLIINAGDESDRLNKNKEMERVIISFGLNLETLKQIVDLSLRMSPAELDAEIISLNDKAKKWFSALLIKLIYIGGNFARAKTYFIVRSNSGTIALVVYAKSLRIVVVLPSHLVFSTH